jgi:DNA invertase Pin-like site-specific DNA recombinase
MRALGYIRCSTDEQALDGVGLEAQRARIAAWCEVSGVDLVEVIEDAGVSGARPLADRPGGARIQALLKARTPDADAVVVVRLDRLGRDAAEALRYLKEFARRKVGLVSISDRIDLGSPQGRAMAGVGAVFAELERALIAQRTAEALGELRATSRVYGSLPFGYSEEDGLLVPHEAEQAVLSRIIELRAAGGSYAAIAGHLNQDGIPAKRGGCWHSMSVRSVLRTSPRIGVPAGEGVGA